MEITANAIQTVNENQNVLFTDVVTSGNCSITHRDGSGLVTLRGVTDQCRARFKVSFRGNIALPAGAAVTPISIAISLEGEALGPTTMIITPAATENYWNVFSAVFIDVPRGCCSTIGVENLTAGPILVQNANLIIERVA